MPTRVDNVVKPKRTLTLSLQGGAGYSVGSPSSATTTITNSNVPLLRLGGTTTISAGWNAKLTVTADQAPLKDTQVSLQLAGDAATRHRLPEPQPGRRAPGRARRRRA